MSARSIYRADICFFFDILVLANSRCWQNAITFHMHADSLCKTAQQTKSRQLSCSSDSRQCIFINKQTRWTMEHTSAFAAKTKALS